MGENLVSISHKLTADFFDGGRFLYALDATLGNGNDALFLASLLMPEGSVFGFDIQPEAIARSSKLFAKNGLEERLETNLADHAEMEAFIPKNALGKISCAFFNLGWLPDSDKRISTKSSSTKSALEAALRVLDKSKSVLSVLSYRGQSGGLEEFSAVSDFFEKNLSGNFRIFKGVETSNSPVLFFAEIGKK